MCGEQTLRSLAVQIAIQLPANPDEALKVLAYASFIKLGFMCADGSGPDVVTLRTLGPRARDGR